MFFHLIPPNLAKTERNQSDLFDCAITQKKHSNDIPLVRIIHSIFFKCILHTFLQPIWTTVMIWYVSYDNIILYIPPHQVVNKNITITRISIFFFVTFIIIVMTISKAIILIILIYSSCCLSYCLPLHHIPHYFMVLLQDSSL